MWLCASNIRTTHGFSDRHGGYSAAPFNSLNLGGSDDDPDLIHRNRIASLSALGLDHAKLCILRQVHSNTVRNASTQRQEGDALVTNEKGLVLAVSVADCFPVLFEDAKNCVIGAAHAGWRGTASRIASSTVKEMVKLGAEASEIRVAIGQGISRERFGVGPEVTEKFLTERFPEAHLADQHVDLPGCIVHDLIGAGVPEKNIWRMNRCTFESDFFSYRRDKGVTGRMWGLISLAV
jgi:polyphenol oxidase